MKNSGKYASRDKSFVGVVEIFHCIPSLWFSIIKPWIHYGIFALKIWIIVEIVSLPVRPEPVNICMVKPKDGIRPAKT